MKKKSIILVLLVVILFAGYKYAFKAPEDISKASADFDMNATVLVQEFSENAETSQTKYFEKVIAVTGTVTEIDAEGITLNEGVFCTLLGESSVKVDEEITVKGLFIGYDDLFEQVKLDQSTVVE